MTRYLFFISLLCVYLATSVTADDKIMPFEKAEIMCIDDNPSPPRMCAKAKCDEEVQTRMDYWYHGYCKDKFPDFVALAVFESQSCPPVQGSNGDSLCVSRYLVISVLGSASDTLKKEYIEVKEYPLLPCFRYRPMLIFGNYNNGTIQIKGYEDVREYFFPIIRQGVLSVNHSIGHDILQFVAHTEYNGFSLYDLYSLHSIGTPYYNADAIDSMERKYYNEYLIPEVKFSMGYFGKDINKLLRRLTQNRTKVKAIPIKNNFAVLGMIKNMCAIKDSRQKKKCILDIVPETIIKTRTNMDSSIIIYKYGDCPSLTSMMTPMYFLGNFKSDSIVIEKIISPLDAFVFEDTIYEISMGFPFDEFLTYFIPLKLSVDDYVLNFYFEDSEYMSASMREEIISVVKSQPEQKKRIDAAIIKFKLAGDSLKRNDSLKSIDFVRERQEQYREIDIRRRVFREHFGRDAEIRNFKKYRCRK
jgi:hypothetical protein